MHLDLQAPSVTFDSGPSNPPAGRTGRIPVSPERFHPGENKIQKPIDNQWLTIFTAGGRVGRAQRHQGQHNDDAAAVHRAHLRVFHLCESKATPVVLADYRRIIDLSENRRKHLLRVTQSVSILTVNLFLARSFGQQYPFPPDQIRLNRGVVHSKKSSYTSQNNSQNQAIFGAKVLLFPTTGNAVDVFLGYRVVFFCQNHPENHENRKKSKKYEKSKKSEKIPKNRKKSEKYEKIRKIRKNPKNTKKSKKSEKRKIYK
jgi:hypothetical protein